MTDYTYPSNYSTTKGFSLYLGDTVTISTGATITYNGTSYAFDGYGGYYITETVGHKFTIDGSIVSNGQGAIRTSPYSQVGSTVTVNSGGSLIANGANVIDFRGGDTNTVTNYGKISYSGSTVDPAIDFTSTKNSVVNNFGTIESTGKALELNGTATTVSKITNWGVIKETGAGSTAINASTKLLVDNYGSITGDIDFRDASANATILSASGNIFGKIWGGKGHDYVVASLVNDTIDGGAGNDIIDGKAGKDTLYGQAGIDTLNGGADVDMLTGGIGGDRFVFDQTPGSANADTIKDFNASEADKIQIENNFFKVGAAGQLSVSAYLIGTKAVDSSDRIIYDNTTGKIYYDEDGVGGKAQVLFATLANKPLGLAAGDFLVI